MIVVGGVWWVVRCGLWVVSCGWWVVCGVGGESERGEKRLIEIGED
ncbi:MAG TPA: hypothetical protein PL128_11615 [Ginsengibacter sp.]|nr:hypothetical protein [Ginsengibacter sp.]